MQKTYCQIRTFNIPVNFDDSAVKSKTSPCNNFFHCALLSCLWYSFKRIMTVYQI